MTIEYLDDPERYKSAYAIVMTPAENALRNELRPLAHRAALTGPERERIATKLRAATRDAAYHLNGGEHAS